MEKQGCANAESNINLSNFDMTEILYDDAVSHNEHEFDHFIRTLRSLAQTSSLARPQIQLHLLLGESIKRLWKRSRIRTAYYKSKKMEPEASQLNHDSTLSINHNANEESKMSNKANLKPENSKSDFLKKMELSDRELSQLEQTMRKLVSRFKKRKYRLHDAYISSINDQRDYAE